MTHTGALRFPYILFDLGSTLIYFDSDWSSVMANSLAAATRYLRGAGYQLDDKAFPAAYHALIQEYYQKRNDEFVEYTSEYVLRDALQRHSISIADDEGDARHHLREALKHFYAVSQEHWHPEPEAVPVLKELLARGHRLGIVSNAADDADVQVLVDKAEIRPYFDIILTSAVAGVRKPNPLIFQKALAHWGVKPEQAVMVGDLVSADVVGANQLGIFSVWITRRINPNDQRDLAALHPPKATIASLSELPGVLDQWS